MADSGPSQGTNDKDPTRGLPHHDQETAKLAKMIKEQMLARLELEQIEENIYKKETEYLEDTPHGNILTGFDNYIKGTSSNAPGGRRKQVTDDNNRVFSKSSMKWMDNTDSPALSSNRSTPMHSHAPTPINTAGSFLKDPLSATANTPTSATSANKSGAGIKKVLLKTSSNSNLKKEGEDSDGDKKVRIGFGAGRK